MSLNFKIVSKKPIVFSRLTGVSLELFGKILEGVTPLFEEKTQEVYKKQGRHHKLAMPERIMCVLMYYRCYMTHEFLGCLFGIHQSQMTRLIGQIRPLLADFIALKTFKREVSKEESDQLVSAIIVDATEQPIERPTGDANQKPYYSGKKKRHTIKTEIRVTKEGCITHVSKSVPGSVHDLTLHKSEPALPTEARGLLDSGYQGLQHDNQNIDLPYKQSKNTTLDDDEKTYNAALSRVRVKVEHIFGDIKVFRIIKETYRNPLGYYEQIFKTIAGIVNIKNGFSMI